MPFSQKYLNKLPNSRVRDQTILFLKMCPKTTGLAGEILAWLGQKVRMLGEKLMEQKE